MLKVDAFVMHDQHRRAKLEHRQWLEDLAHWREEHCWIKAILEEVRAAWDKAEEALEEHALQIQAHDEHLARHERAFEEQGWAVDVLEDESIVAEHRDLETAHADARKAHEKMRQLHSSVMAEVLELLRLTHPDRRGAGNRVVGRLLPLRRRSRPPLRDALARHRSADNNGGTVYD